MKNIYRSSYQLKKEDYKMSKHFIPFILILTLLILPQTTYSDVSQSWVVRFNGQNNGMDMATANTSDMFGNVFVIGYCVGMTYDYVTLKYSPEGAYHWNNLFNGPANSYDLAYSIGLDGNGNAYVVGASTGTGSFLDYCLVKYNNYGSYQWNFRHNGPANGDDQAFAIFIDSYHNKYVTGGSEAAGIDDDFCTIKFNSSDLIDWIQRYNGPGNSNDQAIAVGTDANGNVYVAGYSVGTSINYDYCLIKYAPNGTQQWVARYNGPGNGDDKITGMVADYAGYVFVTGYSWNGTDYDYCTIRYNSNGNTDWIQRYNGTGSGNDETVGLKRDNAGNVFVTGKSVGLGTGYDLLTVKYSLSGTPLWNKRYNGPGNGEDVGASIATDAFGDVYVAGSSVGNGSNFDYVTIKYNSSGVQQWNMRYNGPGNSIDKVAAITLDYYSNVIVSGSSITSGSNYDICTIKYTQFTGIHPIGNEIPADFKLFQNHPNPFNPVTKIRFDIPSVVNRETSNVKLVVYNILGEEITVLINQEMKPGSYEAEFNGNNFPSGLYFYKIVSENFSDTKRMMMVK